METLCTPPQTLRRRQACYALQGPNAVTELQMLAALKGLSPESLPLLPALLGAPLRPTRAHPAAPRHSQQQLSAPGSQQRQPDDDTDAIEDGSQQQRQQQQPQASGQLGTGDTAGADISAGTQLHGGQSSQGTFERGTLSLLGNPRAQQASVAAQTRRVSSHGNHGVIGAAAGSSESGGRLEETQASDERGSQKAVQPHVENAPSIIQRFNLNEEQAEALLAMESWSTPGASQVDHTASSHEQCQTMTFYCRHSSRWHALIGI